MKRLQVLPLILVAAVICITPMFKVAEGRRLLPVLRTYQRPTERKPYLPDPRLTPGDKLAVTKTKICAPNYGAGFLDVPTSYKNRVFASYGLTPHPSYVIDRLISIDLGGANNIKNLWPQPKGDYWSSEKKDQLERELRRRVCSGSLDLDTAQREIAKDWVAAYPNYLDDRGKPKRR